MHYILIFSGYFMFVQLFDLMKSMFTGSLKVDLTKSFLRRAVAKIVAFAQLVLNFVKHCIHGVLAVADNIFSDKLIKMLDESSFSAAFVMFFAFLAWQFMVGVNALLSGVIIGFTGLMLLRDLGVWPNIFAGFLDNLCKIGLLAIMFSGQPVGWL